MVVIRHENKAHEKAANDAEMLRQGAVSAAIAAGGSGTTVQAAVSAAEASYYRSVIASCVANNIPSSGWREGLHNLTGKWT